MNIIDACCDAELFQPFLGDLESWQNWLTCLSVIYGLPVKGQAARQLVRDCTGRRVRPLPAEGFTTNLILTGRRSGKSRVASLIAAFEGVLANHEAKLSPGEIGVVAVCSPTKRQSRVVRDYVGAILSPPLLRNEVIQETREGFLLKNGIAIEILTGDFRTVRGPTLIAAIVDEICYFGLTEESRVKSDSELVRALRPGLATVGGKLVAISSPYAKKGWAYQQFRKHHGNDVGTALVWNCPSRTMNATLAQSVVDEALDEDPAAARSEFLGLWREDVCEFIPRSLVEALVVPGRKELLPKSGLTYQSFADLSGGRSDDATLALAHRRDNKVILDALRRYKPPFSPPAIVDEMVGLLRRFGIRRVTGDNYAADWVASAFRTRGIGYLKSPLPKSQLYVECLPILCSGAIELLDDPVLVDQFASLERRTRSGGRDVIDHPHGAKDDVANAVAGVAVLTAKRRIVCGGWKRDSKLRRELQCSMQAV